MLVRIEGKFVLKKNAKQKVVEKTLLHISYLKFGDGYEPNLCKVNIVNVIVAHFIENIFRSGLTLVS